MKIHSKEPLENSGFFKLKDSLWLDRQRVAGKVASQTLQLLSGLVKDKTKLSMLELNALAENYIIENKCTPTFKNYHGFPAGVCISVNEQLVHGIPTDYVLQEGDVVSFDLGATFEGAIADTALTVIYGEPKKPEHAKIIAACEDSLMKGIAAVAVGKRIGSIGYAIHKTAKGHGFNVINNYGGHGLDYDTPHAGPFVANRASPEEGIRIQPGLAIAIEPMLVFGSTDSHVDKDGWTVIGKGISSHHEHSIFVDNDSVEILTWRNDESSLKSNRIYFNQTTT